MKTIYDTSVKINITNLHFATVEEDEEGNLVFGKPSRVLGAEEATRTPSVASGRLYGDGIIRKNVSKKTGYEISFNANAIPQDWRSHIEGTTIVNGVESGSSKDTPKPVAMGWEIEKTEENSEFIWFPYCIGQPVESTAQQSEDNINFTSDTVTLVALEHNSIKRFYTLVDQEASEENKLITPEVFFSQVQVTDTIQEAPGTGA